MAVEIILSADPSELQVEPGQRIETTISIQNVSNRLIAVSLEITDLDRSWYELSSYSVSIFPKDSATVTLSVSVPGMNEAIANIYPFTVKAINQSASEPLATLPLRIEVLPVYSFKTELSPQRVIGHTGSYVLDIANNGNAELSFSLDATDERNGCTYLFSPEHPRVSPGEEATVEVAVSPNQRKLRGPNELYNFELKVSPDKVSPDVDNLSPIQVFGVLEVPPKLRGWVVPLGGLLAIVLVAAIGFGIFLGVDYLLSRDPVTVSPTVTVTPVIPKFNVIESLGVLAPGTAKGVILDTKEGFLDSVEKGTDITVNAIWHLSNSNKSKETHLEVILVLQDGRCRFYEQSATPEDEVVFEIPPGEDTRWNKECLKLNGVPLNTVAPGGKYAVYLKTHDGHPEVLQVRNVVLRVKWDIPK